MHPLRSLAAGTAVTGMIIAATAAPATAQTRTFHDARKDASAAIDVTKVKVRNTKNAVIVRISVPKLRKARLGMVSVTVRTKAKGRPGFTSLRMRRDSGAWRPLVLADADTESLPIACAGDRMTFGKKAITVRIPQRCLGKNRKAVRVDVLLGRRDWKAFTGSEPEGPKSPLEAYPRLRSGKQSSWVGYR